MRRITRDFCALVAAASVLSASQATLARAPTSPSSGDEASEGLGEDASEEDEEIITIEPHTAAQDIVDGVAALTSSPPTDRAAQIEALEALVVLAKERPFEVADDPAAHQARVRALLAIAQLHHDDGNDEGAVAAIDEAIRVVRGDPLPSGISPALEQLIFERLAADENAHRGSLQVHCGVPCRVVLDERDIGRGSEISARGIPLGRHRLQMLALDDPNYTEAQTVQMRAEDAHVEVEFEGPPRPVVDEPPPPKPSTIGDTAPPPPTVKPWPMPRWISIVGLAAGAAVLASGAVLLGLNGLCTDGSDPRDEPKCPDVYNTRNPGIGLMAGGGALLIAFSITLAIGDARTRRRSQVSSRRPWAPVLGRPWPSTRLLRF